MKEKRGGEERSKGVRTEEEGREENVQTEVKRGANRITIQKRREEKRRAKWQMLKGIV